jgi:hypothetical protein
MNSSIRMAMVVVLGVAIWWPVMTFALNEDPPAQREEASPEKESSTSGPGNTAPSHQSSAAQAAGDPTAPIIQIQIQNTVVPSSYGGDGGANYFDLQPVIPIPKGKTIRVPQIARVVAPLIMTTPDPDRTTGYGDLTISGQLIVTPQAMTLTGYGKPASPPSHSPWKTLRVSHRLTASTTNFSPLTS